MTSINPYVCGRFEIQWRPYVTNGWQLIAAYSERADAETRSAFARREWGGQTRIVAQEVIAAHGLGAQEFGPDPAIALDEDREAVPDKSHFLRCLVAESLEVYATTFALLTENDPPRVDLAANEVQQAHHRTTAALVQKDGAGEGR